MSKIGDLFVKLGLKKDEFSKGLKDAGSETQSFGSVIKNITSKGAVAFAAITTAVVGVVSAIKKLSVENQVLGDTWGRMAASMTASWDTLKTAVASMDFTHLFSNMKEAGRLARELYDAADGLGEIQTSYDISLARQAKHIAELKVALKDAGKTDEERLAAGRELVKIYEDLEKNPTRGLERFSNANLDVMAGKLGFNLKGATEQQIAATRKEVENFFIWLGTEAGEAFNSAYADAYKDPAKVYATTVAAQNFGLSDNYRAMLWNYQAKVGDDDREAMAKAIVDSYRQGAKATEETARIQTAMNSILAKDGSGGGGDKPKTIEEMQREFQQLAREAAAEAAEVAAADAEVAAMAEQMAADIAETIPAYMSEYEQEMADGLKAWIDDTNIMLERQAYINEQAKKLADEFTDAVVSGYVDGIQTLTDQLFGLEDANPGAILQGLLSPLADMAINEGKILMASGLGIEAIKKALQSLNGFAAVAAGAALVALGSAVKSGLGAIAQAGASSGYASTYSGSSSGSGSQTIATEMTIYVEGRISGRDIVLSGQKTVNSWNR